MLLFRFFQLSVLCRLLRILRSFRPISFHQKYIYIIIIFFLLRVYLFDECRYLEQWRSSENCWCLWMCCYTICVDWFILRQVPYISSFSCVPCVVGNTMLKRENCACGVFSVCVRNVRLGKSEPSVLVAGGALRNCFNKTKRNLINKMSIFHTHSLTHSLAHSLHIVIIIIVVISIIIISSSDFWA